MKIKKKYISPYVINGEKIAFHITWEPSVPTKYVEITIPPILKVLEVFNASDWDISNSKLMISKLETEGYLGAVLKSDLILETYKHIKIKIQISDVEGGHELITLSTKILRPKLTLYEVPLHIKLESTESKKIAQISFKYDGFGTTLVNFEEVEKSEIKIDVPIAVKKAVMALKEDMKVAMEVLSLDFPEFREMMKKLSRVEYNSWIEFFHKIELYRDELDKCLKNEDFKKEFTKKLIHVFSKNPSFEDVVIQPFIEYISSVVSSELNIILTNPLAIIKVDKEEKLFEFNLIYFDLLGNQYKPIRVSTKISGTVDRIPLYKLFKWVRGEVL